MVDPDGRERGERVGHAERPHGTAVVHRVHTDRHTDCERRHQLVGRGTDRQQEHPGGDGEDGQNADGAEVVIEQDDATEGGQDGAAAASDGVGDGEVTVLVGGGEEQEVRDVDGPGDDRRPPCRGREIPGDDQHDGSDDATDDELRGKGGYPVGAALGDEVPRSVQPGGGQRQDRRGEHVGAGRAVTR